MSAVEFASVDLVVGGRAVLRDVSFALARSEFVGVLGPNGAGKTTLMRAILGLVRPARGVIRVGGAAVKRGNPGIGYMPQTRAAAFPRLRGWDFVAAAAGGHRWGLPVLGIAERRQVDRALDRVGAADLARRPLGQMSGGERQRLLLAQALLGEPRLLLLDEPLLSLDPAYQRSVVGVVRQVQRDLGITVLFSAHELNPLLGGLDRVLYLGNGRAALGTVDDVVSGPVLTRLYGSPIDVVRHGGRIFVVAGEHGAGCDACL